MGNMTENGCDGISVIIATFNSLSNSYFKRCIESVRAQSYEGPLQVLVVDGGSSDGTVALAEDMGAQVIQNDAQTELGRHGGKNLALSACRFPLVTMVDADNILIGRDYFRRLAEPMLSDPEVSVAVPMPFVPRRREVPSICRYFCLNERDYWLALFRSSTDEGNWSKARVSEFIVPNAGLLRKTDLFSVGGWDYDTEVARRLCESGRGVLALVPGAHRLHLEMRSYGELVHKFRRRSFHAFTHWGDKPANANELSLSLRSPVATVNRELLLPLKTGLRTREAAYLNAIPTLLIKSICVSKDLLASRWQLTSHGSAG